MNNLKNNSNEVSNEKTFFTENTNKRKLLKTFIHIFRKLNFLLHIHFMIT